MKVLTVLGTRPEIIRLSRLIPRLDQCCDHVLVHTGQNREPALSEIFFHELGVRPPDRHLNIAAGRLGERIGRVLAGVEDVLGIERPDRMLVLGDTDSGLAAFVAKRLGVPVYHMEAGNRCYDDRVAEEVNRRVIDHSSDVLLPYTQRSRRNLLREGIPDERIRVTGNPIYEVLEAHRGAITASDVVDRLGLVPRRYLLATIHRQENVDHEPRLRALLTALAEGSAHLGEPLMLSVHPRTREKLHSFGIRVDDGNLLLHEPFGFADFVKLEENARLVLTDSGTVQEECCLLGVPTVTVRDTTERPETVDCGSNRVAGVTPAGVLDAALGMLAAPRWIPPPEYLEPSVSARVAELLLDDGGVPPGTRSSPIPGS